MSVSGTGLQFFGPIQESQPFMMTYGTGNYVFAMSLGAYGTDPINYVFSDQCISDSPSAYYRGQIGIFTATGTSSAMIIQDTVNGGYLSLSDTNYLVNSTTTGTYFNLDQISTQYQNWNPPNLFLGNVLYSLNGPGASTAVIFYLYDPKYYSGPDELQFQILPTTWYYNIGETCMPIQDSLETWACAINSSVNVNGLTCASAITGINNVWTNLADCSAGITYTYCETGTYCGTTGCNGPCVSTNDTCENIAGNYICMIPPPPPVPPQPQPPPPPISIWRSAVFIGTISGILAVIIILIVILLLTKKNKEPDI
jgi:hypothetical protein